MSEIRWYEEIENIFKIHGPSMAIAAVDQLTDIPPLELDVAKASIFYRWQRFIQAKAIITETAPKYQELPRELQLNWFIVSIGIKILEQQFQRANNLLKKGLTTFPDSIILLNQQRSGPIT